MKFILFLILTYILSFQTFCQNYSIKGKVFDKKTGEALSYANVRILNTFSGTAANKYGEYELKLKNGKCKLSASYIGYESDTLRINVNHNTMDVNFYLEPSSVTLSEVVVRAGENFAVQVVKKAITEKNRRNKALHDYEYDAYTRGVVLSQKEISARENRVNMDLGVNDTIPLKVSGILESESKGYFEEPDKRKEIIVARKQTANFPAELNTLTSGRIVHDFYEDKIRMFGRELPGPLADNSPDFYYFDLVNTTSIDNRLVYEIHMEPKNPSSPGYIGNIFITDGTFDLIKVDLLLNKASNYGGILDSVSVLQEFAKYDSVYMPVNYKLSLIVQYLNLFKLGFELNSVIHDYKINTRISNNTFSKAVVTVLPDADKKTKNYWNEIQSIPYTKAEKSAYSRIDSLSKIPVSFWDNFSYLSTSENVTDNFSITGPLGLYHFNKVEGSALDFGFSLDNELDKRFDGNADFSYGFSDKKFKSELDLDYKLGDYRTYDINFHAFRKIAPLFVTNDFYKNILATVLPLLTKSEVVDYYYTDGFDLSVGGDVFPILNLSIGFMNHTDRDAFNNTNFSFFNENKKFKPNTQIYETKINALKLSFNFDFRDYVEDGYFRRRIYSGNSHITFGGSVTLSDKSLLKSDLNYLSYTLHASGRINTFGSEFLGFRALGMYTNGNIPYQSLYALPGNIDAIASSHTFRTLDLNQVFGDEVVALYLEHNFRDDIFRFLHVPGLQNWQIQLSAFLDMGYSNLSNESKSILPTERNGLNPQFDIFTHPFYEAGFEISHPLIPFGLSFAWKLNYRGKNNFRIGLSSPLF